MEPGVERIRSTAPAAADTIHVLAAAADEDEVGGREGAEAAGRGILVRDFHHLPVDFGFGFGFGAARKGIPHLDRKAEGG